MFVQRDAHGNPSWQLEREDMLDVVQYARRKAAAPLPVYLERINDIPAREPSVCRIDAGFLRKFARCCALERLIATFHRAGDGLPVAGTRGALQEQDLAFGGM